MRALHTPTKTHRRSSLSHYVPVLAGVSLLLFVAYQEWGRSTGRAISEEGPPLTSVLSTGDGPVDRLQVVLCVSLDGPVAPPSALREWIFTAGEVSRGVAFSHDGPSFSGELRWQHPAPEPDRRTAGHQERLLADVFSTVRRTDLPYSSMTVSTSGAAPVELSLDDDRRFSRIAGVIGAGPLALQANRDECVLLARPLRKDDTLGTVSEARARAQIGAALRSTGTLAPTTSELEEFAPSPIARVLSGGHPIGVLCLLAGVALLLHRRVSLLRGAAILLTAWVLVMSLSARLDTTAQVSRLHSDDPGIRAAAAGRLATCEAFAPTAARALRAAYDVEKDPSVRAAIVYSLIQGLPIQRLTTVLDLLDVAASDPDPIVRRAISRREPGSSTDQG